MLTGQASPAPPSTAPPHAATLPPPHEAPEHGPGVIARLNALRLSKGKKVLGFLNPWIYGTASSGFHDVTHGSNPGNGKVGFTAIEGWDAATGFGTPNFAVLSTLI